jgi:phosphoribosylformylglycinamidine synthase subunit PurQ / glutaminase
VGREYAPAEATVVIRKIAFEFPIHALRYAGETYPANPNGSMGSIAGVTDATGTILGLMPHPEDHIIGWQHPRWSRGEQGCSGLPLFEAGIKYAAEVG